MLIPEHWFFEVLSYHPPPRPFESFSGYLIRLFEGNGISDLQLIQILTGIPIKANHALIEYPPNGSFGDLPKISMCSLQQLRETTLFHLFRKFATPIPKKVSPYNFLAGSVSDYLRLCSLCFIEDEYYSLIPRFLSLEGCSKHGCQFLERCPSCNSIIPLLYKDFRMGHCIKCGFDLRESSPNWLADSIDINQLISQQKTIEFLLLPHPDEDPDNLLRTRLAYNFLWLRELNGYTAEEISTRISIFRWNIWFMEYVYKETSNRRAGRLKDFQNYSDVFEVKLEDLFTQEFLPDSINLENTEKTIRLQVRETALKQRVATVIYSFHETDEDITQKRISAVLGFDESVIGYNVQIRNFVSDEKEKQRNKRRQIIMQSMINLFEDTDDLDMLGSRRRIADTLKLDFNAWRYDNILLDLYRYLNTNYQKFLREEVRLLRKMQAQIEALTWDISQKTANEIAEIFGYDQNKLEKFPEVLKFIFSRCKNGDHYLRRHLKKESYWVKWILEISKQVEDDGIQVSQRMIKEKSGKSFSYFYRYTKTRQLLQNLPTIKQIQNMQKDKSLHDALGTLLQDYRKRDDTLGITTITEALHIGYDMEKYRSTAELIEEIRTYNRVLRDKEDIQYLEKIIILTSDGSSKFLSISQLLSEAGLSRRQAGFYPTTYAYILKLAKQNSWLEI